MDKDRLMSNLHQKIGQQAKYVIDDAEGYGYSEEEVDDALIEETNYILKDMDWSEIVMVAEEVDEIDGPLRPDETLRIVLDEVHSWIRRQMREVYDEYKGGYDD